jgi:tRNA G18 (ribose-2'-O)-methylase SpoU
MRVVRLEGVDDPRFADRDLYRIIGDHRELTTHGLFVAEGRLVVERLIEQQYAVRSMLLNDAAFRSLEAGSVRLGDEVTAFICDAGEFERLTGYDIHRGCLALARRPAPRDLDALIAGARSLVALEDVANADNVGGIFRNAAAFGVDAVVLSRGCVDPLYRKTIRTSMASVLRVPFAVADGSEAWHHTLARIRAAGFQMIALTPGESAIALDAFARNLRADRLALLAGAEGTGLTAASLDAADVCVRIPIRADVDSLNVSVATGIALHRLLGPDWSA